MMSRHENAFDISVILDAVMSMWRDCIIKTHVRGFFDTDLHEVSWHFATHEAVRPSGF